MIKMPEKYKIQEELGRGSFGVVYKAEHISLQRTVAIKVLSGEYASDSMLKKRFLLEARLAAALSHENLAVIYDFGENSDGLPFIVMEYVGGYSLREVARGNRLLPQRQKLEIAEQICRGLRVVHANKIIHRDIKPANVMIREDGRVKILDFGIAKALSGELNSQVTIGTIGTLGTINYMSPEQTRGDSIDHRSDIFSFGVLLYEMVTRRVPFQGSALYTRFHSIQNDQPVDIDPEDLNEFPEVKEIIWKCLEKSPEARYQSISETGNALRKCLGLSPYSLEAETRFAGTATGADEEATVSAGSASVTIPQETGLQPRKSATALRKIFAVVALLLIATLSWWIWPSGEAPRREELPPGTAIALPALSDSLAIAAEDSQQLLEPNNGQALTDKSGKGSAFHRQAVESQPAPAGATESKQISKPATDAGAKRRVPVQNPPVAQPDFRARADSLRLVTEQLRMSRLDVLEADSSGSFFSAAISMEAAAQEHLKAGNFSRSDSAFQAALVLYRRGFQEQLQFENALNLFRRADYPQALSGLQRIIDAPARGEANAAVLQLYSRAQEAQKQLDNILLDVRSKVQQQDLRGAMALLDRLGSAERDLAIVREHRESVVRSDRQLPRIVPELKTDYDPKQPLTLAAAISDNLALASCSVHYRQAGKGEFEQAGMHPDSNGRYEVIIPVTTHKGRDIEYIFYALDTAGNTTRLDSGGNKPFVIKRREKLYIPRAP